MNGYPIVFSDTAGIAEMGLLLDMGWDKPWVYGPLMDLWHWGLSFWGVVAAQTILVSLAIWWTQLALGGRSTLRHVGICAVLAVGSAAPWFACLVMPDIFAPLAVLALFVLGWGGVGRVRSAAAIILAAVAIAAHLAHLVLAAGCLVAIAAFRWRRLPLCAAPVAAALAWLLASNAIGNGVLAVSPYGAVFALARLQADGPAAVYLQHACPAQGGPFCAWAAQMPMDSDKFLWDPDGPIWGGNSGPTRKAAEAARIVSAALRYQPWEAFTAALGNTLRQLILVQVGDTLVPSYLEVTVGRTLRLYMPPAELARFEAARQVHGTLPAVAAPLAPLRLALLALGAAGTIALLFSRRPRVRGLAALVLVALVANAAATGALSGPHDRYQARIAWLVLLPPLLAARPRSVPRDAGAL